MNRTLAPELNGVNTIPSTSEAHTTQTRRWPAWRSPWTYSGTYPTAIAAASTQSNVVEVGSKVGWNTTIDRNPSHHHCTGRVVVAGDGTAEVMDAIDDTPVRTPRHRRRASRAGQAR